MTNSNILGRIALAAAATSILALGACQKPADTSAADAANSAAGSAEASSAMSADAAASSANAAASSAGAANTASNTMP
jgi:hypothetical protein